VSPVNLSLNYLKNESQYFEGIDLKTNLYAKNSAFTMGSIHMYPHELVELPKVNDCGNQIGEDGIIYCNRVNPSIQRAL